MILIFMKWLNDEVVSWIKISKAQEWDWNDKSSTFESTNKKKIFLNFDWLGCHQMIHRSMFSYLMMGWN